MTLRWPLTKEEREALTVEQRAGDACLACAAYGFNLLNVYPAGEFDGVAVYVCGECRADRIEMAAIDLLIAEAHPHTTRSDELDSHRELAAAVGEIDEGQRRGSLARIEARRRAR